MIERFKRKTKTRLKYLKDFTRLDGLKIFVYALEDAIATNSLAWFLLVISVLILAVVGYLNEFGQTIKALDYYLFIYTGVQTSLWASLWMSLIGVSFSLLFISFLSNLLKHYDRTIEELSF